MKATTIVYWPGKTTHACDTHTAKLLALATNMGFDVQTAPLGSGDIECKNCENEAKKKAES